MSNTLRMVAALLASLVLAACGGGGGGGGVGSTTPVVPPPVADDGVPATAQGSVNGLLIFMKTVAAVMLDTNEPRNLGDASLPVSEDMEPDGSV